MTTEVEGPHEFPYTFFQKGRTAFRESLGKSLGAGVGGVGGAWSKSKAQDLFPICFTSGVRNRTWSSELQGEPQRQLKTES